MADKSTKVGRSKEAPAKAVTLNLPVEMVDELERMADAQVRARSNMMRVLLHLGMQAFNRGLDFAAEMGIEVPAPGQSAVGTDSGREG